MMELVSIQEASRRLRLSTASIRECIRNGELKAHRQPGPNARLAWVVEMPEEGWTSAASRLASDREYFPWWCADQQRTGGVHYIQDLFASSFEEVIPRFFCGVYSDRLFSAGTITEDQLCAKCLAQAQAQGLPTSLQPPQ